MTLLPLVILHETSAQPCSICGSNGDEPGMELVSPDTVALNDGTTCEQLVFEAELNDESDDICASFYQVIGFATCGCSKSSSSNNGNGNGNGTKTNNASQFGAMLRQSYCNLCSDGSLPDPNAIYDANTLVTCDQVQDYLQINVAQSEELCNVIQYQGVVNCGCPYSPIPTPSCSLCKQEGESVLNLHELAESGGEVTTCGAMEYILAMDVEDQYHENTCSELQNHFSSKCNCGQVMRDGVLMMNTTTTGALSSPPSKSPSILVSNSPINEATDEISMKPTFVSSSQPTLLPSEASSFLPSVMPSIKDSSLPSSSPTQLPRTTQFPSTRPSVVPSSEPTFEGSLPPTTSTSPSNVRSMNPTLTNAPSFSPSSILDRAENCTALENGIFPNVQDKAENLVVNFAFDLWVEYQQELEVPVVNVPVLRSKLMHVFDRQISLIAAGCMNPSRRLGALDMNDKEKIYNVEMTEFSEVMDVTCAEVDIPVESSATVVCIPVWSSSTVYYSSLDTDNGAMDSAAAAHVDAYITSIVQNEFSVLAQSIPGIYNGTIVDEFRGTWFANERSSSGKKVAIGVGVGCSLVALVALGIVARRRQDTSLEAKGMIAEGQIRSDDSISDNPTISSGRRAQMTGWEGSIADDSSSQYSRQMLSARRASDGMDARWTTPYQLRETSYLPGNVLRDLLGADDGDLSIGSRENDDLSIDPVDTIDL